MHESKYTLGWYLVGFLDVLGQREKLRNLRLPNRKEEEEEVFESLRSTAGIVLGLRKLFGDTFENFQAGLVNLRREMRSAIYIPNFYGFSDSFVISLPLGGDEEHLRHLITPLIGSYCALSTASVVMISSLASKHALRGGIDVGLGLNISPREIYGPGLERAYFLESQLAQYPRVLIGDELWKFLSLGFEGTQKMATPDGKAMNEIVKRSMELVIKDADGKRMLDFLGAGVVTHAGQDFATHLVKPAYDFVLEQQELPYQKGMASWLIGTSTCANILNLGCRCGGFLQEKQPDVEVFQSRVHAKSEPKKIQQSRNKTAGETRNRLLNFSI